MKRFINISKTFFCILVVLILAASVSFSAFAAEPKSGSYKDFIYTVSDSGKITITAYTGEAEHVVIPNVIDEKKVVYIGSASFSDNEKINYVTIPENVAAIDENAFSGCTNLERVMIPRSMETIKSNAFAGCTNLDKVFYCGTEYSWEKMDVPMLGNSYLLSCEFDFECQNSENIANNFPVTLFVWIIVGVVAVCLVIGTVAFIRFRKGGNNTPKKDNSNE